MCVVGCYCVWQNWGMMVYGHWATHQIFSSLCITNTSTLTLINTSKHFIHFKYGNFQFSSFKNPTCSLKNEIGMQQIFRTNAQILIYFVKHDKTVLSYEVQGMQQFWYNHSLLKCFKKQILNSIISHRINVKYRQDI